MKETIKHSALKSRTEELIAKIQGIETRIGEEISGGPAAAETNRLVAASLCKIAAPILENLQQTVEFITVETTETNEERLSIDPEVIDATVSMFGVAAESVLPFALESAAITLPIAENLIATAIEKLDEADKLTEENPKSE